MTRMLTIISGAGILVLVSMPILFLGAHMEDLQRLSDQGYIDRQPLAATRALFLALIVLGVTVSGALALITIRLSDRYFRG